MKFHTFGTSQPITFASIFAVNTSNLSCFINTTEIKNAYFSSRVDLDGKMITLKLVQRAIEYSYAFENSTSTCHAFQFDLANVSLVPSFHFCIAIIKVAISTSRLGR